MNKDPNLVNNFFRHGIPYLLSFDPWKIKETIDLLDRVPMYNLFIEPDFMDILKIYGDNWNKATEKYFTWQQDIYEDPVQQCYELIDKKAELFNGLFENINIKENILNPQFFNLFYLTAKHVEHLMENILTWALTHKFSGDVSEDVLE